jgi:hypothetical protein
MEYKNGTEGLSWTVRKEPIHDARGEVIEGYASIVREDTGKSLSVMGSEYEIVQNEIVQDFARILGGTLKAGETGGGRSTFAIVDRGAEFNVPGVKNDGIVNQIILSTSHDGTSRFTGRGRAWRVV